MILFQFKAQVNRHWSQKNNNKIRRAGNKLFIGKDKALIKDKEYLTLQLKSDWRQKDALSINVHTEFKFYFADFYTKKGNMSLKLGDLSNLYQMPEDCLQIAGIIADDALIRSHDGSRKLPSPDNNNYLEIIIRPFIN